MSRLLLALWLLQAGPQGTGAVTGTVRSSNGTPTARVRVYAVTYREAVEAAKSPPALESLTETDASGKYRLDLPPGRYHIASGSVAAPTYFPGTTDISAARVITVATGGVVSGIDFGSFVPANRNAIGGISLLLVPPGNGVLSGVLRYADGKPASGIHVAAIPSSAMAPGTTGLTITSSTTAAATFYYSLGTALILRTGGGALVGGAGLSSGTSPTSDNAGAFRIENLGPETYYIVSGYADAPVFYPGTPDAAKAKTITTTNNSKIDALDFTVPADAPGVTISGKVLTSADLPASGATVRIQSRGNPVPAALALGLPLRSPRKEMIVAPDGLFAFNDVAPGNVVVEALFPGVQSQTQNIVVTAQPLNALQFVLPIAMLTGRIVMEDGSPVPNPQIFAEAIVTTVNNPNIVSSTIFPISRAGTFTRLHEGGDYRFYLRVLPEEYEIKSIQFGTADLLKETLKITGKVAVDVEVRVAKRSSPAAPLGVRVAGTALDAASGLPVVAERVTLCCRDSGPFERFSAPLLADGSFAFADIPPGIYTTAIQPGAGKPNIYVLAATIDVGSQALNGVAVVATPQFGQLTASIEADGAVPLPASFRPSVVFTGTSSRVRVVAERNTAGIYLALVPLSGRYTVTVENLPDGYAVKSITGSIEPRPNTAAFQPIVIVIERTGK